MKISKYLALGLLVIGLMPVFGQPIIVGYIGADPVVAQATNFTKFSLDFPGGTPGQLVTAVEKVTGKSLNVIILDKDADVQLPPFKLNNVCLPELFLALRAVSQKTEYVSMLNSQGFTSSQSFLTSYEFYTLDHNPGTNSVWYFHVDKPDMLSKPQEKTCRFYQLAPYLERGLTVNDITTAIQTGWKMQGVTSPPQISFHKETRLLIAVGEPDKLEVIDAVLKALESPSAKPAVDPITGLPLPKVELPRADSNAGR
ncbi:MAG: hypothetical protein ABSF60_05055 [Verrucomicrobiota bacterium]